MDKLLLFIFMVQICKCTNSVCASKIAIILKNLCYSKIKFAELMPCLFATFFKMLIAMVPFSPIHDMLFSNWMQRLWHYLDDEIKEINNAKYTFMLVLFLMIIPKSVTGFEPGSSLIHKVNATPDRYTK